MVWWFNEASGFSGFKHDLFIGSSLVILSLNVAIRTSLRFNPFLILCRDIFLN